MKVLILFLSVLGFFGCEELPFTNEDIKASTDKPKNRKEEIKEQDSLQSENELPFSEREGKASVIAEEGKGEDQETEEKPLEEEKENKATSFLEEEITVISEDLELKEDTVIQNRKVILDMVLIKTFEHNLFIKAEEFVSNHSVIRNFPESEKAKKKMNGRNGGNILISTERAIGELQLVLSGEEAGSVPRRRFISKEHKESLRGQKGRDGSSAVYKKVCRKMTIPLALQSISIPIFSNPLSIRKCWEECIALPTVGEDGGEGASWSSRI